MSDLLIKGMDLPKEGRVSLIAVFSDGDVKYIDRETFLSFRLPQKAIEVPTHGDLIDRSLALGACHEMARSLDMEGAFEVIENAPTVIEASKERE